MKVRTFFSQLLSQYSWFPAPIFAEFHFESHLPCTYYHYKCWLHHFSFLGTLGWADLEWKLGLLLALQDSNPWKFMCRRAYNWQLGLTDFPFTYYDTSREYNPSIWNKLFHSWFWLRLSICNVKFWRKSINKQFSSKKTGLKMLRKMKFLGKNML